MKAGISFSQPRYACRVQSPYVSNWTYLGPFNTDSSLADQYFGMITAISVNPKNKNEIYVGGSSSGLFRSMNGGKSWDCLTDNAQFPVVGIKHIHVNYLSMPRKIMLFTGESFQWYDPANFGVIRTQDGGKTWVPLFEEQKGVFNVYPLHGFAQDSVHDIMYTYGSKNILRSLDGGSSWVSIFAIEHLPGGGKPSDYTIKDIALSRDKEELFVSLVTYPIKEKGLQQKESMLIGISGCNALFSQMQIKDYTEEIRKKYTHEDPSGIWNLRLHKPSNQDDVLYVNAQYAKSMSQVIYFFNTATHQVDYYTIPNKGSMREDLGWRAGLQVNPINPACMYMAGNVLHRSLDSGKTFQALYDYGFGHRDIPHADIRSYHISKWSSDGLHDEVYLGTDGGLSYSDQSGSSFKNLNGPSLPITQFYGLGVSPFSSAISAGSQDNSILTYLPQEKKWIYNNHGDGYDVEYSSRYPFEAYGQYNYRTIHQTDNDRAPFPHQIKVELHDAANNKKTLQAYPNGDLYFAEKKLHQYHRHEKKWEQFNLPTPHAALAFMVAPSDSSVMYVSSLWSGLYQSNDGGKSFNDITSSMIVNGYNVSAMRIHSICIHPKNPKEIWLGLGYLGDYYDLCRESIRVMHSVDGGKTWQDYSKGLPVYSVADLVFLEGTNGALFASTLEGIYFREDSTSSWGLYSNHFPKCVAPELKIDYCRGKIIAATYGRGLWESDLPLCRFNDPLAIQGKQIWEVSDSQAALPIFSDIDLGRKGVLIIRCPVHMGKGKSVFYRGKLKQRLRFEGEGKIINSCGEEWGGVKNRSEKK